MTGVRRARSAVFLSSGSCGSSWWRASPGHSLVSVAMTLAAGAAGHLPGVAGLQDAVRVDVSEGPLPAADGALVSVGPGRSGRHQRVVRPPHHPDPLEPRTGPVAELIARPRPPHLPAPPAPPSPPRPPPP